MSSQYSCPFCMTAYSSEYEVSYHIEEQHTDDSPFVSVWDPQVPVDAQEESSGRPDSRPQTAAPTTYLFSPNRSTRLRCTRPGCGERVTLEDIDSHLAKHDNAYAARAGGKQDLQQSRASSRGPRDNTMQSDRATANISTRREPRTMLSFFSSSRITTKPLRRESDGTRLGRRELGEHAYERAMPGSVRRLLEEAARPILENRIDASGRLVRHMRYPNETSGLIHALARLAENDDTHVTTLCHSSVRHVYRIRCDGNFCGYYNIQMLLTYILTAKSPGRGLPTVLQIQEAIERAWDQDICAYGRRETGGIYNTRKWIGTHEALAFFTSIGVDVMAGSFQRESDTKRANAGLLDYVEEYFSQLSTTHAGNVQETNLAPIYLQRAGHSVTVIGIRRHKATNERSLLVFDPSSDVDQRLSRPGKRSFSKQDAQALLEPYVRSEDRLARWNEFEILTITDYSGLSIP